MLPAPEEVERTFSFKYLNDLYVRLWAEAGTNKIVARNEWIMVLLCGMSQAEIGREFGLTRQMIGRIVGESK